MSVVTKFVPNFLTLQVQLSVVQMLNGEIVNVNYLVIEDGATELLRSPTELLRLEPRSSKTLYLSVSCPTNGNYTWEIYTQIQTSNSPKVLLAHVMAEVCYPLLRMTHLSCSELIPKQLLYRWSNVAKIDKLLGTTPKFSELDNGSIQVRSRVIKNSRFFQI